MKPFEPTSKSEQFDFAKWATEIGMAVELRSDRPFTANCFLRVSCDVGEVKLGVEMMIDPETKQTIGQLLDIAASRLFEDVAMEG